MYQGKIGTHSEDQQHHDHQVRQSFGVLPAVDRADAEGKKSGENSGDRWIRAGVDPEADFHRRP